MKKTAAIILALIIILSAGLCVSADVTPGDYTFRDISGREYREEEGKVNVTVFYNSNDVDCFNFFDDLINSGLLDEEPVAVTAVDLKAEEAEKYSEYFEENKINFVSANKAVRDEISSVLTAKDLPVVILSDVSGKTAGHFEGYMNPDKLMEEILKLVHGIEAAADLRASSVSYNSVSLSWTRSPDADGYSLLRSDSESGEYKEISDTESNSFTDVGLATAKKYYYMVRAYKDTGNGKSYSDKSPVVSATAYLGIPYLSVKLKGDSAVLSFNQIKGADGYIIMKADASGEYAVLAETEEAGFRDYEFSAGDSYKVRAFVGFGEERVMGTAGAAIYPE